MEIASISYTNNNYSIDKSEITLNIVPKKLTMKSGITAITYERIYDGSVYKSHVGFDANTAYVAGIAAGDHIQVNFQTPSAAAGTYTNCITFDETIRNNKNYDISALVFEFTIKPKDLDVSGVTFTKVYDGTDTITREFTSADGLVDGDTFSIIAKMPSANVGVGAASTSTVNLDTLRNYTFSGQSALDYVKAVKASAEITPKTITLPADKYTAEYTGTSRLTVDISEYAVAGDTLTMSFQAMRSVAPILPISAVGSYADVNFVKISYSDTVNYKVIFPTSGCSLEIIPKKITNLDLKVTYGVYDDMYVTLLVKDGIVAGEEVKLMIGQNHATEVEAGTVFTLQQSFGALLGENYEVIASMTGADKGNYELVAYDDGNGNMIYGTLTIVARCDVQFDGSCNCGTSHLTETLTFPSGEAVGAKATIDCDFTYEGGIYKIALEGGKYEFSGSDQFFNISGIYDENGNKIADRIGTYVLPAGTYYFHVYVGSVPSSDTIWVKKVANVLDDATMASAIVPDMYDEYPENREHNLGTHNGGDTFVLFYSTGEDDDVLGRSISFFYDDGDSSYSATSNIESIEFYDVNGIQLDITYDDPDMVCADGVTAVGGVYIVVTMNAEGMDNLYFSAC